ncbi:MAG TPA: ATP-binding protein [Thermoanaerobaculia bacterium]|nr:ATP-binding protein [Thermoanaerobaculia bacterium]
MPLSPAWWDPRRSLGARLVVLVVPTFLLLAFLYTVLTDRIQARSEAELNERLVDESVLRERASLRLAADRRARQIEDGMVEAEVVLDLAVTAAKEALEKGPSRGLVEESLEDVAGQPIRTLGRGGSAAMVSRAGGAVTAAARRDLAATRSLEATFANMMATAPSLSATYVVTTSGVLRVVPWRDVRRVVESGAFPADFRVPGGTLPLAPPSAQGSERVTWTGVYDDLYANRGKIVSALRPVYAGRGTLVAEVGIDWALEEIFSTEGESRRPGEVELVFDRDGRRLLRFPPLQGERVRLHPARPMSPDEIRVMSLAQLQPAVDADVTFAGEPALVASRRLREAGWTYARVLPTSSLAAAVSRQVEPVYESTRMRRRRTQAAYAGLVVLLASAVVVGTRRLLTPLRRMARFADAVSEGDPRPALEGTERNDEVGRLARALHTLDARMRRRIRSMEGIHDLARTASVMTRPDETFARLSRRIAELVSAEKSWIALFDNETRSLMFMPPGYGIADERLLGVRIGLQDHSMAMLAYRTGETYVSNDLWTDPRVSTQLARAVDVKRNATFVPLKTEVGTLGVLLVCDKPGGFDDEDLAAIQGYADEAALLLRNARLYDELQRSYERLRDAYRNRDYFLQNVNHELRTPLTAILGWSEVLCEDKPEPETVVAAVEQIRRSAEFLLTLISDLLDLARLEEEGVKLTRVDVDLATLVRGALEPIAVMAEGKGIALVVTTPSVGEAKVHVDPIRMKQVLWNLVHNAVKFTHRGGRIDVEAEATPEGGTLLVRDNGVGVDPKDLPFIFERFRQADGSTTRAYRGTGIGLSLAKAFVDLHGGTIDVESRPGRGATFTVKIPAREEGPTSTSESPPEAP